MILKCGVTLLHVDQELLVLLEDPEALVALYDHQGGTGQLHWLLLDGEVGERLLRLLLNAGQAEGRAGRGSGRQPVNSRGPWFRWRHWTSGGDGSGHDQTGPFLHVLLHVLSVAEPVDLQVLAQLLGVEDNSLLAQPAGVVDDVDDLPLGVPVPSLVLSEGEGMFLGDVFPQAREEVEPVADVAEDSARHVGVVAHLLGSSHFARLF